MRRQEAERSAEETERKLLEQTVEAAQAEARAAEAERANLEMRSQLYASIGIMAGSYAHNIKNLLVRPNDLINRCLEADGLPPEQTTMLHEVKSTLGTVTERLQQILRTVRRDPNKAEMTRLDLNDLIRETGQTWGEIGREKWKLAVDARAGGRAAGGRRRPVAPAAGGREPACSTPATRRSRCATTSATAARAETGPGARAGRR